MNITGTNQMSKSISRYSENTSIKKNITHKVNSSKGINLKINDEETGRKALTSIGFPDGSTLSVFEAENSTKASTKYDVKYWSKDGEEEYYNIEPLGVDPRNASYIDMLAYSTYFDVSGRTQNAFGDFVSSASGINGDLQYDSSNINIKTNFMMLIEDFMKQQYKTGNMAGYLSVKRFYDCMG